MDDCLYWNRQFSVAKIRVMSQGFPRGNVLNGKARYRLQRRNCLEAHWHQRPFLPNAHAALHVCCKEVQVLQVSRWFLQKAPFSPSRPYIVQLTTVWGPGVWKLVFSWYREGSREQGSHVIYFILFYMSWYLLILIFPGFGGAVSCVL